MRIDDVKWQSTENPLFLWLKNLRKETRNGLTHLQTK